MPYADPIQKYKAVKERERSLEGLLVVRYRMIRNRVKGKCCSRPQHFEGKPLEFTLEEFIKWSLQGSTYKELHQAWVESGYCIKFAPSVDRLIADNGYVFSNIEWVTKQENDRRARETKRRNYENRTSNVCVNSAA